MHYQYGYAQGNNETILYNQEQELTEAAACNVYVVKNGIVATPLLDHQNSRVSPVSCCWRFCGATAASRFRKRVVTLDELAQADEVWISSSSKDIAPVIEVDGKPVGDGEVGDVWLAAQTLYSAHKFDF